MIQSKENKRFIFKDFFSKKNLFFFGIVLALVVALTSLFVYDRVFYLSENKITATKGEYDLSGSLKNESYLLSGQWEVYLGEELVSNPSDSPKVDGYITLPNKLSWMSTEDGLQTPTLKASLRMVISNISNISEIVRINMDNTDALTTVYFNRKVAFYQAISSYGLVYSHTVISPLMNATSKSLEIIIEINDTSLGGINGTPTLIVNHYTSNYESLEEYLRTLGFFFVAVTILLICISFVYSRKDKNIYHIFLLFLMILSLYATRSVSVSSFGLDILLCYHARWLITLALLVVMTLELLYISKVKPKKKTLFLFSVFLAHSILLNFLFPGTPLSTFLFALYLLIPLYGIYHFLRAKNITKGYKFFQLLFFLLLEILLAIALGDSASLINEKVSVFYAFFLAFLLVYDIGLTVYKGIKIAKDAKKIQKLENDLALAKRDALNYQIQPHFVFNCLTSIQQTYRLSVDEGEKALLNFASHLRAIVDQKKTAKIPFSKEAQYIQQYFELENLRRGGALNLLLDLEYEDFYLPPLSIEPFVENAIKHADLSSQDSYVSLSTYKEEGKIHILIEDNGKGFDVNKTTFGVGFNNGKERLIESLHATFLIESRIGEGTKIEIIFDEKIL